MIGRKAQRANSSAEAEHRKSFDDFEIRLGDVLRGERATMGKSLLDVQRELRIKATYISAIENCDPGAFETPGFIAGYVRSYARYLNMDPDETYDAFCAESGFTTAHGMSQAASTIKKSDGPVTGGVARGDHEVFLQPKLPFAPEGDRLFSRIEPAAIASSVVLLALIGGIGFGGYTVFQQVQRVQITPVDQTPVVLSDLDPLQQANVPASAVVTADVSNGAGPFNPPSNEVLDRLYRPEALDIPVVIARDAPISTLDPSDVGVFADAATSPELPRVDPVSSVIASLVGEDADLSLAGAETMGHRGVTLVATRDAWVRVRGDENEIIYERLLAAGDTWDVPEDVDAPRLTVGDSGGLFFAVNGQTLGPAGPSGTTLEDVILRADSLQSGYALADLEGNEAAREIIASLDIFTPRPVDPVAQRRLVAEAPVGVPGQPRVLQDATPGVTVVAARPAWVRVRSAEGSTLFEGIMNPGDTYQVPALAGTPSIRVGESGAIYFAINGETYGPAGARGQVSVTALSADTLKTTLAVADLAKDQDLTRVVAELNAR